MDSAIRHNKGKPKYSLIDYHSLEPLVRILEWGEDHYSRNNWRKGLDKLEVLDSLQRHIGELIDKVNEGKDEVDNETQIEIIGHIMANCMFYSYYTQNNKFVTKTNNK
jgi:hypothetical protein